MSAAVDSAAVPGRPSPVLAQAGFRRVRREPVAADGVLPDGVHALADAPSRCPVPELRADQRRDVFWSGDWIDRGNPVSWTTRAELEREAAYFGTDPVWPDGHAHDRDAAEDAVAVQACRPERLGLLGACDQWRTATVEQLAAIVGTSVRHASSKRVVTPLLSAGLLDYGTSIAEMGRSMRSGRARHLPILRPSTAGAFERVVRATCTYAEWVSITGGLPFSADRQFDRHNLLATELGLRAAEYCDGVGAVLGEKLSGADLLFEGIPWSHMGGDLTIVRRDGLRIVVELTATASSTFRDKARRWARLLDRSSLASSGVVVLFVEASKPGRGGTSEVLTQVVKQVQIAARAYSGVAGRAVADRMFVAKWSGLFPGPHAAAEEFFTLRAQCPAGALGAKWSARDLLDEGSVRLDADDPEALRAVLTSSRVLAGSPFWLRDAADAGLWNTTLGLAGIDVIPARPIQTSVLRADGTWGRPEAPPPPAGEIRGLGGGEALPRAMSRGLPPFPPESRLLERHMDMSQESSPAWAGTRFDARSPGRPVAVNPFEVHADVFRAGGARWP